MRAGGGTVHGAAVFPVLAMRRATAITPAGSWPADQAVATVTLDFDDRFRRRIKLDDDAGEAFLLDLSEAAHLRHGDGLRLEDGGMLAVHAAPEDVIDIACGSPRELSRIAWHLGNRHTPVQVLDDGGLRIRYDHVLMEMVIGLGATAEKTSAPFDPEPGAYSGDGNLSHSHSHGSLDHAH